MICLNSDGLLRSSKQTDTYTAYPVANWRKELQDTTASTEANYEQMRGEFFVVPTTKKLTVVICGMSLKKLVTLLLVTTAARLFQKIMERWNVLLLWISNPVQC
ncbi:hypothetical protein V7S43_011337 [Phytophthora oleae]|uniref:Uncharacterized protein n=1 Tax=Phytophthora oleae TaxID=2107226 RepID=A0ABD3FAH9_9STRA